MLSKQFANTLSELENFSKHFSDLTRTVKAEVPKTVLDKIADRTPVDSMIFKDGTVTIHPDVLDSFNSAIKSISIIP
jgi:hypothetical protein